MLSVHRRQKQVHGERGAQGLSESRDNWALHTLETTPHHLCTPPTLLPELPAGVCLPREDLELEAQAGSSVAGLLDHLGL